MSHTGLVLTSRYMLLLIGPFRLTRLHFLRFEVVCEFLEKRPGVIRLAHHPEQSLGPLLPLAWAYAAAGRWPSDRVIPSESCRCSEPYAQLCLARS